MRPRAFRLGLALSVAVGYAVAALYPFDFQSPESPNGAEWMPGGGVRFGSPGVVRSRRPPPWISGVRTTHRFDVHLQVTTASIDQKGPARILTVSRGPYLRNFTVGQRGRALVLRLRTPWTNYNGLPEIVVPRALAAGRLVDVRVGISPGQIQVTVNGVPRFSRALPSQALAGWDPSLRLYLGNEATGDRPWLGQIHNAVIQVGALRVDYAREGALERPSEVFQYHQPPYFTPFRQIYLDDMVVNVLGFVPLGLLLGWWLSRRKACWRRDAVALLLVVATSLAIEVAQVWLPSRHPSVDDLIFNSLGGALGIVLARVARSHRLWGPGGRDSVG